MTKILTCEACGATLEASNGFRGRPRRFCNSVCKKRFHKVATSAKSTASKEALDGRPVGPTRAGGLSVGPYGTAKISASIEAGISAGQRFSSPFSWYYAKFAAPHGKIGHKERREIRYKLRQLLNQVSEIDRCKRCGRDLIGGAAAIVVNNGVAHFSGVETCGRIWLCPVCAAKIRARRGDEIAEAVGRHITNGGGAYFVTATLPHDQGDALTSSLDVLTKAWSSLMWGKAGKIDKERFGIVGNIKAIEITHGRNGWHPHIHAVILTKAEVSVSDLCDWYGRLDARWARALVRNGWSPGEQPYRFRFDLINRSTTSSKKLAAYVTKVQESGLGNEIARADLKGGRKSSRTPFQILANFGTDGLTEDRDLWLEYEKATIGKRAIRWSPGLRELLIPDVEKKEDDEIAAEEIGGETVAYVLPQTWYRLADIPGAQSAVLDAVEADGWAGLISTLLSYRVGTDGLLTPDQWASHTPVYSTPD